MKLKIIEIEISLEHYDPRSLFGKTHLVKRALSHSFTIISLAWVTR